MESFIHFAHPWLLCSALAGVVVTTFMRVMWHRTSVYRFSLGSCAYQARMTSSHPYKTIFWLLRFCVVLMLAFLVGKPQIVDRNSSVVVEGIDIVLVLDVSGSMQLQDDPHDPRSRVDIAKTEAIRFIDNRENDALGLVIFGNAALSRCPLTLDKSILKTIVNELEIGVVDPNGTVLSQAIVTAANRLKKSQAKSKIMIVLTDGEPSDQDINPDIAIEVAKQLGIKMYTVGIGSEKNEYIMHPLYGVITKPRVNTQLLQRFAQETGGRFFMAHDAHDMRTIYDTINALETTEYETPIYSHYHDIFMPFVWFIVGVMLFEVLFSALIWFGL